MVTIQGQRFCPDIGLIEQLGAAFDRAEAEAKAVVLAGRDGKFCAGFDLGGSQPVKGLGAASTVKVLTEAIGKERVGRWADESLGTVPVNFLTGGGYDPVTKTAELKVCPVRIEVVPGATWTVQDRDRPMVTSAPSGRSINRVRASSPP